jgi:hypothetical protein
MHTYKQTDYKQVHAAMTQTEEEHRRVQTRAHTHTTYIHTLTYIKIRIPTHMYNTHTYMYVYIHKQTDYKQVRAAMTQADDEHRRVHIQHTRTHIH